MFRANKTTIGTEQTARQKEIVFYGETREAVVGTLPHHLYMCHPHTHVQDLIMQDLIQPVDSNKTQHSSGTKDLGLYTSTFSN